MSAKLRVADVYRMVGNLMYHRKGYLRVTDSQVTILIDVVLMVFNVFDLVMYGASWCFNFNFVTIFQAQKRLPYR